MKYREFLELMKKYSDNKNLFVEAKKGLESMKKLQYGTSADQKPKS